MSKGRISGQIIEDILRQVGSGELTEGMALPPEAALCERYGVGRSVAREAISALSAKGFLIARQGSATVVAPRNKWQVLDPDFLAVNRGEEFFMHLQVARELLEPGIAALAAQQASPSMVARLKELTAELDRARDPIAHADLDIAFHEAIAEGTRNPVLFSLHNSITSLGRRTRILSAELSGAVTRAHFWHSQIVEAFEANDPVAAKSAMRLHLRQVKGELERLGESDADHDTAASAETERRRSSPGKRPRKSEQE